MGLLNRLFGTAKKPPKDRTQEILARHLDGDFRAFPMAESQQEIAQVEAIGRKVGIAYPPEFTAHICGRFPGIYVEVKEEVWARPKMYDVGPFWSFLYALHTFTSAAESAPWMRLDNAAESFRLQTGLLAGPVLQ